MKINEAHWDIFITFHNEIIAGNGWIFTITLSQIHSFHFAANFRCGKHFMESLMNGNCISSFEQRRKVERKTFAVGLKENLRRSWKLSFETPNVKTNVIDYSERKKLWEKEWKENEVSINLRCAKASVVWCWRTSKMVFKYAFFHLLCTFDN